MYKQVLLAITVPAGKFCAGPETSSCSHIDVTGERCNRDFGPVKFDGQGHTVKTPKCLALKDAGITMEAGQ